VHKIQREGEILFQREGKETLQNFKSVGQVIREKAAAHEGKNVRTCWPESLSSRRGGPNERGVKFKKGEPQSGGKGARVKKTTTIALQIGGRKTLKEKSKEEK